MIEAINSALDAIDAVPPMTIGQILISMVPMVAILALQVVALITVWRGNRPPK